MIGLTLVLGLWAFAGSSGQTIQGVTAEMELSRAVGLVVCGLKLNSSAGERAETPASTGTCFTVSPHGYLLTNKHVVDELWRLMKSEDLLRSVRVRIGVDVQPTVWVFFGQEKLVAQIIHVSDAFDLAILKVDRRDPFFRLSASDLLPRATRVYACGFPSAASVALSERELTGKARLPRRFEKVEAFFRPRDFEFGLNAGALSRTASEDDGRTQWLQHDASTNAGNSGGPLLTEDGVVVGINTQGVVGAAGINYALAVSQLRSEIDRHVRGAVWK